jgi:arabinofuranan 3-O-arabinosyltransferase
VPGWTTDSLVLRDRRGELAVPGGQGPDIRVDRKSSSAYHVVSAAADEPYLLVLGQNNHPGWRATMDGVPLGPPVVVDGYAMGWWVRDLDAHVFDIEYAPQGVSDLALAASGGAVLLASALVLVPGRPGGASALPHLSRPRRGSWVSPRRKRRREQAGWFLFVLGCGVFAGLTGVVAGSVVALWSLVRSPDPRTLLRLSALAMLLAPLAWVLGNLPRWGVVSPQLVLGNPAPSVLVIMSLVLLVVGSWLDAGPSDGQGQGDEDSAGPPEGPQAASVA